MTRFVFCRPAMVVLAPLLLLGACGTSSAPQASSTASGEILPGSVSDAMLDTDRSQALAPLAPAAHSVAAKVDPGESAAASDAAADTAIATDAAPGTASTPAPKAATVPKPATP